MSIFFNVIQKFSPAILFSNNGKSGSIISPLGDFFFVGGISFLFLPILFFPTLKVSHEIAMTAFAIAFVINYPHFMHSYQLLYKGFLKNLRSSDVPLARKLRFILSGIIVPLFLIELLFMGVMQEDQKLLGYGTNIMLFLVGWHYAKQGYGILMTLSVKKKIFYSDIQKKILLLNVYACWLCFWSFSNTGVYENFLYGIPYESFAVPKILFQFSIILCVLTASASVFVLAHKLYTDKQISINGIVGYVCATYIWLKLVYLHPVFIYFVPALHSLQYLLFVWKMQYEKTREEAEVLSIGDDFSYTARQMRNFLGVAIALGCFSFYLVPVFLDQVVPYNQDLMGVELFMYVFIIFINVHHYFIDFSIWRRDNPDMQYLFK